MWGFMQGISKEMLQLVIAFDIAISGAVERHVVTHKRHIKRVMIYTNSHRPVMYMLVYLLTYSIEQDPS
jgi:hypothetical protein